MRIKCNNLKKGVTETFGLFEIRGQFYDSGVEVVFWEYDDWNKKQDQRLSNENYPWKIR